MTPDELREFAYMVKAFDLAVRQLPDALWPLCTPAERIFHEVEETRYTCPMCRSTITSHRCDCPVTTTKRGLRSRRMPCR